MANIDASRRAIEEAFGQGKVEVLDEICAADWIGHDPISGDQDLAATKETIGVAQSVRIARRRSFIVRLSSEPIIR